MKGPRYAPAHAPPSKGALPMIDLSRRDFIQTASLLAAGGYAGRLLAGPAAQPTFAAHASFVPTALFLTWQHDPTTTMTVQWIGDNEQDGLTRPIWYAKDHSEEWRSVASKSRRFPL